MKFLRPNMLTAAIATAAALSAGPAPARTFRIATGDGPGGTQEALGKAFIAALEERSGGSHGARLFLNSQLGTEQATVNDAAMGVLDMSIVGSNNLAPFSPTVGILSLPYLMSSIEDAEKITQGPVGQQLIDYTVRDAGVRILGWAYSGFRVLSNSKKPVKTVDDLQGLQIRVPQNKIMIATYRSWGIEPTPLPWAETFTALQMKVIDGQDLPIIPIYAVKFDEVQTYITNLHAIFLIEPLFVSESIFEDLPPADRKILVDAGRVATKRSARYLREREGEIRVVLAKRGMKFSDPADGEAEFMQRATSVVWPKFYDSVGGVAQVNRVLTFLGRDSAGPVR